MGMGEPLANLTNLLRAIRIINAPWGFGIGARHITISTSGLAPQIRKLALEPTQFRLAISLHGATDEVRSQIMPVNRKYNLATLFDACDYYVAQKKRLMFEYILIAGVNDSDEQAHALARHAGRLSAKINLIPYNTVEGLKWSRPSRNRQENFLRILRDHGAVATLRREKGHDIAAACGQLRCRRSGPKPIRPFPLVVRRACRAEASGGRRRRFSARRRSPRVSRRASRRSSIFGNAIVSVSLLNCSFPSSSRARTRGDQHDCEPAPRSKYVRRRREPALRPGKTFLRSLPSWPR